jgi:hypothetical protein
VIATGPISRVGSGYTSTRMWSVATGLITWTTRTIGNGLVLPPYTRHFKFTILALINYLSFDRIRTWSVRMLCSFSRSFTSRCQICDQTIIRWVAIKYPPIARQMSRYLTAIQWILVRSQIWKRELKVRLVIHTLCTYHIMIQSELKYWIEAKVGETATLEPLSGYHMVKKQLVFDRSG